MNSLSLILSLLCAFQANAEVTRLGFEDAARLTLGGNVDLEQIKNKEESFKFRSQQAFSPNNPVLTLSNNNIPSVSPFSIGASSSYTLSWTLGFPGKAFASSASLANQAYSFKSKADAKEIELLTTLSNLYVSFIVNKNIKDLMVEELRKSKMVVDINQKKYATAQVSQIDLLNSQYAVSRIQQEIISLDAEQEILLTQFRNLIRKPSDKEIQPLYPEVITLPDPKWNSDELIDIMMKNKPGLKSAEFDAKSAQADYDRAKISPLPDFQLAVGTQVYNYPEAQNITNVWRDYTFSVGISVPIFYPFNEMALTRAAARDRDAADNHLMSQKLQAAADIRSIYAKYQANMLQIKSLFEQVLPAAKASYELAVKAYSVGRTDYPRLNETRSNWINTKKQFYNSLKDTANLYNQISQGLGCVLNSKESRYGCQ